MLATSSGHLLHLLSTPFIKSEKSGFFTWGKAAQENYIWRPYSLSLTCDLALIFPLLPLPHAPVGILPNCPEMAHRATVRASRHCTAGDCKPSHRHAVWAASAPSSLRPIRPQSRNLLKPYRKVNYGPNLGKAPIGVIKIDRHKSDRLWQTFKSTKRTFSRVQHSI